MNGKPAVSKAGWEGYGPDRSRLTVWGINGYAGRRGWCWALGRASVPATG